MTKPESNPEDLRSFDEIIEEYNLFEESNDEYTIPEDWKGREYEDDEEDWAEHIFYEDIFDGDRRKWRFPNRRFNKKYDEEGDEYDEV